jgi:hypothetical protein
VGIGQFGPGSEHNPSGKCANCPVNTFGVPLIGDKEVPACRGSIEAMVALPDTTSGVALFRLRFGGIAFAAARAYWDSFRARLPKIPPIGFLTRMVLEPTDTKNGKFLGTVFSRVEQLNRADVQPLIDERDRLIEDFKRIVAEEVETRQADVDERDNRQHDEGDPFPDEPNDAPSTGLKRDTATSAAPSTPAPATPDPNEPF